MGIDAGSIYVKINADTTGFGRGMNTASAQVNTFGQRVGRASGAFSGFAKQFVAFSGAALVAKSLASVVRTTVEFERGMRNVNSIAKLSEKQFQAISKAVLSMAKEVGQKPKVLAAGLYDIVSSGFKAADATKILRVSAIAATAGLTDTATASKAVTAALNAYHLGANDARKVSDVLFQVVNKGVLTFEELSLQMGDLVPVAAPLGVKLGEVGAAMSTLTLQGVPAAEAATRVKNVMIQLAKPSEALTDLLRAQGFASGEAAVAQLGFAGVLEMLSKATKGNVTETAKLTPEIRSLMGVVGLTGVNLKTYKEHLLAMNEATKGAGMTQQAFAEQSKSVGVQWQKLSGQIDEFKVRLGTALLPVLSQAIQGFSSFMTSLRGFEPVIRTVMSVLVGFEKAMLITLITPLRVIAALIRGDWTAAWNALKAPVKAALDAVRPLVGGIKTLVEAAWKVLRAKTVEAWTAVQRTVMTAVSAVSGLLSGLAGVLKAVGVAAFNGLLGGFRAGWNAVTGWLSSIPGWVKGFFGNAGSWLLNAGKNLIQGFIDGITSMFGAVKDKLGDLTGALTSWKGPPSRDREILHSSGQMVIDGFVNGLRSRFDLVRSTLGDLTRELSAITRRREQEDLRDAVRAAQQQLAVAKAMSQATTKEVKERNDAIRDANKALTRALEDIEVDRKTRLLSKVQATYDAIKQRAEQAAERLKNAWATAAEETANRVTAAMAKITAALSTPAERELTLIQRRREQEDLAYAVAEAERHLGEVRANPEATAEEIADAERQLARAREDITIHGLEAQARVERAAMDARIEAANEHMQTYIAKQVEWLDKGKITLAEAIRRIVAMFQAHRDKFREQGEDAGHAFADGVADKIQDIDMPPLKIPIEYIPGTNPLPGGGYGLMAHGGPVKAGDPYVVGEKGPELFIPKFGGEIIPNSAMASALPIGGSGGSGAMAVVINVYGSLIHERELEDVVVRASQRWSRRNGPVFSRTVGVTA